ncbi:MAG TPA: VOC family protein [Phycisphaerae bacterium]|nr:VOC family protein [Phycisphaerae bacterium]
MGSPLCHFEFMSNDPDKCRSFYGNVFGWEYDDKSMPGYTLIKTDREPGGGLMKCPEEAPGPVLSVYFDVPDIDAALAKVTEGGGTVVVPKTPIPDVGSYAMFTDPEGICVGLFET